jgi:AraC-like DNA-binding protein
MKKKRISERAVDFILSRENEDLKHLTEQKVAQGIGANRSYLSRSFKIDQNITLAKFVKREKIHRALFILDKEHEKSIIDLSIELGFMNIKDFILEFKNQVAIEPEKYRDLRKISDRN